jgi:shikimate kinase
MNGPRPPGGSGDGLTASRSVLLVGLMAVGKSTIGRELAGRLGYRYLDNDDLVAAAAGTSLAALLHRDGTGGLRRAESAALTVALSLPPAVVAGVAAGVVDEPADRARLVAAAAVVVWLRARPATLAARVGDGGGRPWLRPDPLAAFERMATARAARYAEVADLVVDVDDLQPAAAADVIVRFVRAGSAAHGS